MLPVHTLLCAEAPSCESHTCSSVLGVLTKNSAKGVRFALGYGSCEKVYKSMFGMNDSKEKAKSPDQTPSF